MLTLVPWSGHHRRRPHNCITQVGILDSSFDLKGMPWAIMPRRRCRSSTLPPSHTNAMERRLCFLNISWNVLLCGANCFYRILEACSVMHKHLPEISLYQSKHPYFNIRLPEIQTICRKSTSVMGRFVWSTFEYNKSRHREQNYSGN